jgi:carbon monoxide dehydrogenase subunit G
MREVLREEVTVDRSEQTAWDHLSALERWPSWAGHIKSMDPTPPGELTASTSVKLHMSNGMKTAMTVTEYDPPHRWVWEGRSMGTVTRFEHRFEPLGEGRTRIWFLAWVSGPLAGPGGWWFGRAMKRNLARAFPKLKAEIESRPA